jgi:hypothetical protein
VSEQSFVPALRPLGIGEILDVGIKITTRHYWTLVRVVLVVVVPIQVLASIVTLSAPDGTNTFDFETGTVDEGDEWTFIAAALTAALLTLVAQTIATGVCFKAVADAYLGRVPSWRRSLGEVVRRLHSILWISFLTYLLAGLALIPCILPGIWLYFSWTVAVPAFLTEGVKGRRALGRSFRLVKGFWWRTFAIIVLGSILSGIIEAVVGGLLGAVSFTSDDETVTVLANLIASVLAGAVTTPFIAAVTIVLYVDLRVRKEGFDLQLLAERIGLTAPPEGGYRPAPGPAPAPRPTGGAAPPFWPPPPGWRPPES